MRIALIVIGIILLGLGVWVAMGDAHYNHTDAKLQVASKNLFTLSSQKPVPAGIGYAAIAIGGVLVIAGVLKKK